MKAAILSILALVTIAGCASPPSSEDSESTGTSGDALSSIADEPAVVPADGVMPKVESVDASHLNLELPEFYDSTGKIDMSRVRIDVLDTGSDDHDYMHRSSNEDMKWVESDKHQLPAFVDTLVHGVDVGGGKCRIQTLTLKKVVVGCKWTW